MGPQWTVEALQATDWFGPLLEQIQRELDQISAGRHKSRPSLETERRELDSQIQGWSQSLANPALGPSVRQVLETNLEKAVGRCKEIERESTEIETHDRQARTLVDPQQMIDRLNRLADVLSAQNPSRLNLELSLHIEGIHCFEDGHVAVRTCKLGALAGAVDLFATKGSPSRAPMDSALAMSAKPRRRAVRRIGDDAGDPTELRALAHRAADVERFAGLGPEWFWEDTLRIPRKTCWAEQHALEIAAMRKAGRTQEELADLYQVSIPTIRKALRFAVTADVTLQGMPKKMPRARWPEEHFGEVAELRRQGLSVTKLCEHFQRSEPLIREALRLAQHAHDDRDKGVENHDDRDKGVENTPIL